MVTLGDILILGLGSSGEAAARYCAQLPEGEVGSVCVADVADTPVLRERASALESLGVRVDLGSASVEGSYDLCIASPGIPPHAPLMVSAREAAGSVISELEFAFRRSDNPWVAVTGTNGKTTTTALVTHLLLEGGVNARSVGNIGAPAIEAVADASEGEVLVAEVSSFQLALTESFHPRVAVLLNITPDHIDWHGSFESYAADKAKVFANLGRDDVAVIDVDDTAAASYADDLVARQVPLVRVSRHRAFSGGATVSDGVMMLGAEGRASISLVAPQDLKILGPHNISNALAAAAAAYSLGVSAAALRSGLTSFEPIEHRLEPAGQFAGAEWFNDSKATNPDAVSKALDAFGDRPMVLLLGGRNKGNDFAPLATQAAAVAREVVVFGEARSEIARAFEGTEVTPLEVATLADAVETAAGVAQPGDAVVLSPACASFDEFSNYEERGRSFKSLVARLGERRTW